MNATDFGSRVRAAREALGLTQGDLAKRMGATYATVSQWETGVTKQVKADLLLRAAKALRTTPDWLLYGIESSVSEDPGQYEVRRSLQAISAVWDQLTERQRARIAEEVQRIAEDNNEVRGKPKG